MTGAPRPSEFPLMFTMREAADITRTAARAGKVRTFQPCPVCRLAIDPRLRTRHAKACARRKREAPELWREWRDDMTGAAERIAARRRL